jgi:hypothetical protein
VEGFAFTAEDAAGMAAMLFASLLVGGIGYRIRVHREVEFVAGYDPEEVTDNAAIARLVGNLTLGTALLTVLYGLAVPFAGDSPAFWGSYVVAILAGVAVTWALSSRYRT